MALEVFKLFGSIFVNTDEADKSISKTTEKAKSFGEKLSGGIKTAAKWGTAVVGGATAIAGGLSKMALSSAETADKVDKMSQKIGISRQAYQELDFICSQSGMSVDSLQMGMKTLVGAMDGAASGTATNVEQFEKLGISAINADGSLRNQEDVMWETIQALQEMDNEAEKARLANELFGRSGSEMMPLLNGEAESVEEMKKQAHELGLVLNDETVNAGVSLTDTMDQMKRSLGTVATKLGGALMPMLEKFVKLIIDNMPMIQGMADRIAPIIAQMFEQLLPPLMQLAEELFPVIFDLIEQILPPLIEIITAILPVITNLITMLLPPIIEIVTMLLPLLVQILEPIMSLLQPLFELLNPILEIIMAVLTPLIELINMILPPIISLFTKIIEFIMPPLQAAFEWLAETLSGALAGAFSIIQEIAGNVMKAFGGLIDFITGVFTGDWEKAWQGISDFVTGIWDAIWGAIKGFINLIIDGINMLWSGIYGAVKGIVDGIGSIAGAIGDLFGQDWHFSMPEDPPLIPKLARGGIVDKSTLIEAGEDGAEAIVPLEKNTEWIDVLAHKITNNGGAQPANQAEKKPIILNVNIQTFNNYSKDDIRQLAEELCNYLEIILGNRTRRRRIVI